MSVGNLKTYGNKGNNFPFQLATLKGLAIAQLKNLTEDSVSSATAAGLETNINALMALNPNGYLVSKSVVYDSSASVFVAFLTIASL